MTRTITPIRSMELRQKDMARGLRRLASTGMDIMELIKNHPNEVFRIEAEFCDALNFVTRVVHRLDRL